MGKIKVTCEINDYSEPSQPCIKVHNHWNYKYLVEIEVDGKRHTVDGHELKQAVDNAMNVGRI